MNNKVICLYPRYNIMYELSVDLMKELTHGKTYESFIKDDVVEIQNDKYDIKEYDKKFFIEVSEYDKLELDEKVKLFDEVSSEVMKEKYPKGYDFENHEIREYNMEDLKGEYIKEYVQSVMTTRAKCEVLEIHLNSSTIDMVLYDIKKKDVSKYSMNVKNIRKTVDYSDFLKMRKREIINSILFGED